MDDQHKHHTDENPRSEEHRHEMEEHTHDEKMYHDLDPVQEHEMHGKCSIRQ